MASRIRAAVDGEKGKNVTWFAWANGLAQGVVTNSAPWISWGFLQLRQIGWFFIVAGMLTALPLIFEVKREAMLEEQERQAIAQGIAEGKTPVELANQGLAAVEPKVL